MESLRSFSLLLGSTVLSLVLFEGAFRAVHLAEDRSSLQDQLDRSRETAPQKSETNVSLAGLIEPSAHSDIVYELKPQLDVTFQGQPVRTNRWGMRAGEIALEKKPGTLRIAGLGDSIMFGWAVREEKSYLNVLQQKLRETLKKDVEVLNFGVPGYNTSMEVALLSHKAIRFEPDLILIQFVNNDWDVPAFMLEKQDPLDLSRSFLVDFVRDRMKNGLTVGQSQFHSIHDVTLRKSAESRRVLRQYTYMTGIKGFRAAMDRLTALTKAKGIPVVVFYGTATRDQVRTLRSASKKYGFHLIPLGAHVNEYFAKHGLTNTPEERKKLLTVSPSDRHPSELGHAIIGGALADQLTALLH